MSIGLIIGMLVSFASLLTGYKLEHGLISSLVLLSPFVIVFGGTWGAVIASSSFKDILAAFRAVRQSFSKSSEGTPGTVIETISNLSEIAKKNGLLALENEMKDPKLDTEDFLILKEGLLLLTMGKSNEEIRYTLGSDIRSYITQRQMEIEIFEAAGGYSPTMGIIGTVLGLVQVLSSFSSPEQLTSAIAVAFIATLYGVTFANVIYFPIATRLKRNMKRHQVQRQMIMDGVCMIADGVSPRDLQNRLALYYQAFEEANKYKQGINN